MYPKLLTIDCVAEIIIVNNDSANTPDWLVPHKKVRIIDHGKNIYVNPAWNQAVAESKFDRICLLSDDVECHPDLFSIVHRDLTAKVGVIGPHVINFKPKEKKLRADYLRYMPTEAPYPIQPPFGCLMFVHKDSWHPIPEEFKIYYGDTFLCSYNYCVLQRLNHYFVGIDLHTTWGTTSKSKEFSEFVMKEHMLRAKVFSKYIPQRIWKEISAEAMAKDVSLDAATLDRLTHK